MNKRIDGQAYQPETKTLFLFSGQEIVETIKNVENEAHAHSIVQQRVAEQNKVNVPEPISVSPNPIQEQTQNEDGDEVLELDTEFEEFLKEIENDKNQPVLDNQELEQEPEFEPETKEPADEFELEVQEEEILEPELEPEITEDKSEPKDIFTIKEEPKVEEQVKEKELQSPDTMVVSNVLWAQKIKRIKELEDLVEEMKNAQPQEASVSTSTTLNGFFKDLSKVNFYNLQLDIIKDNEGNLTVMVIPKHNVADEGLKNLKPFYVTGKPEEIDLNLIGMIAEPLGMVQELIHNTKEFLEAKQKAEKESAIKKEEKEKIKKKETEVKKIIESKDFDPVKDKAKLEKAVKSLMEVDKDNKLIKTALEKLETNGKLL